MEAHNALDDFMPIFGKPSIRRTRKPSQEFEKKIEIKDGRTEYQPRKKWYREDTPFAEIKTAYPFVFSEEHDFIARRHTQTGRPVAVLEWGCGNGRAISEIAEKYGVKVATYGFSEDSYMEWENRTNVKFIHQTPHKLLRYIRNGSIDLIYSFFGIHHMLKEPKYWEYFGKLVDKLSTGGKMVFHVAFADPRMTEPFIEGLGGFLHQKTDVDYHGLNYMVAENRPHLGAAIYITKK